MPPCEYKAIVITQDGRTFTERFYLPTEANRWMNRGFPNLVFSGLWKKDLGSDDSTFKLSNLVCTGDSE